MSVYPDYHTAREHAQRDANEFGRPMGLERAREFNREMYRVKFVPVDPAKRFGWELRCEIVEPERTGGE